MKAAKVGRNGLSKSEVNISPMIDMVFILLIFFVVAAVFVEDLGFETRTQNQIRATIMDPPQTLSIHLDHSNRLLVKGDQITFASVRAKVSQYLTSENNPTVLVNAEAQTNAGLLVRVLDQVRLGGAEEISLALESVN